uniref:Nitroreductase domain-containing protein n=1 Tax=Coccolithus braarudii TaxID=221442 RepID=A0A7S0LVA6_9EUKA|mmetsp:Transcript_7944/g.17436  ORF Transcript_7944/g.17436 Transcript_7944/m.17436 type:complete len:498 (+) Transcript_7944:39-1532(+)
MAVTGRGPAAARLFVVLLMAFWDFTGALAAASTRKLVETQPFKAMALMRTWQSRAADQNRVKTLPDGKGNGKLKVVRALSDEERMRRALCNEQFSTFLEATSGLAEADKSEYPQAKRQLVPALDIAGAARGRNTKVFASVGGGATTLALVEVLELDWSVLLLCVNPDVCKVPMIAEAEEATLAELQRLCEDAGARLRVLSAVEASLAANEERLGLTAQGGRRVPWLYVGLLPADANNLMSWFDSGIRLTPPSALEGEAASQASEGREAYHVASWFDSGIRLSPPSVPSAQMSEAREGHEDAAAAAASASVVHDALRSRRTINAFKAELPGGWNAALRRAVEAATFAPNHKRTEPWRFHLLGPQGIRRVCELNAELVATTKGAKAGEKKLGRWLAMPGWLVVTCVRSEPSMDDPAGVAREDYAACCCAVQNLCLSLHAEGIGTKWTTGPVNFDTRFSEAAGLSDDEYVVGTIWFGEAAGTQPAPPSKRPIDDVLFTHS